MCVPEMTDTPMIFHVSHNLYPRISISPRQKPKNVTRILGMESPEIQVIYNFGFGLLKMMIYIKFYTFPKSLTDYFSTMAF